MFPSISRLFLRWMGAMAGFAPLDPPMVTQFANKTTRTESSRPQHSTRWFFTNLLKFVTSWSCHPDPSWTTLASHTRSHKFQNLPHNVPSLYKLISLLCFLTCYTLFIPLRSSSQADFVTRSIRKCRNRAFAWAGPAEWNKLPVFIRKSSSLPLFKTNLKTSNCVMIRHFSVTRFCARLFLFRYTI